MELRNNTYFWLVFVVLTLAMYLLQAGTFVDYKSQINVLLLPKNERIASNIGFIKNNLEYLFDNEYERRGLDRSGIETISKQDNTIITFEISANDQKELKNTDRKVVQDFFDIASQHYNIKSDLEMKLVGDVIVESQPKSFALALLISAVIGFVISFLVFWLTDVLDGIIEKISNITFSEEKILRATEEIESKVKGQKFEKDLKDENPKTKEKSQLVADDKIGKEDAKESEKEEVKETQEKEIANKTKGLSAIERLYRSYDAPSDLGKSKKQKSAPIQKAAPPSNLPIGNFEAVIETPKSEPKKEKSKPMKSSVPSNLPIGDNIVIIGGDDDEDKGESLTENVATEPTNEEYKKRLNQLLKGEL